MFAEWTYLLSSSARIHFYLFFVSRCREVEQDVVTLKAQLVEKQAVQTENDRLKLQLDSMQAQSLMEQRKAGEERSAATVHTYLYIDMTHIICIGKPLFLSPDATIAVHFQ